LDKGVFVLHAVVQAPSIRAFDLLERLADRGERQKLAELGVIVNRLEKKGYLRSSSHEDDGGRIYRATALGRKAAKELLGKVAVLVAELSSH